MAKAEIGRLAKVVEHHIRAERQYCGKYERVLQWISEILIRDHCIKRFVPCGQNNFEKFGGICPDELESRYCQGILYPIGGTFGALIGCAAIIATFLGGFWGA